jgi:vitamin B12/bleomycin/antimicrobial peptide transport system ATP-binding/permease protein
MVSIAHRPAVAAFHTRQWVLTPNQAADGAALFSVAENPA